MQESACANAVPWKRNRPISPFIIVMNTNKFVINSTSAVSFNALKPIVEMDDTYAHSQDDFGQPPFNQKKHTCHVVFSDNDDMVMGKVDFSQPPFTQRSTPAMLCFVTMIMQQWVMRKACWLTPSLMLGCCPGLSL